MVNGAFVKLASVCISLLLTANVFFINRLVTQLDNLNIQVNDLSTQVAVLNVITKTKNP